MCTGAHRNGVPRSFVSDQSPGLGPDLRGNHMTDFGGEASTRFWSRGKLIATIAGLIGVFAVLAIIYVIMIASDGSNTALEEAAEPPAANVAP